MAFKTRFQKFNDVNSSYRKTTLPNGLRIITEEIRTVKSVSLGVWVNNGSGNETPELNGISHFIEHMVFKGTKNFSLQQIARSIESVGGYMNAFTTKEHTCYYCRVLDEYVEKGIHVLSELVQFPLFPVKELEKEKSVVLEEIKNAEDDPDDQIHEYFEKFVYTGSTLAMPVIGTSATVSALTQDDLFRYMDWYYTTGNTIIAAAGNITHAQVVDAVNRYFTLRRRSLPPEGKRKTIRARRQLKNYNKPIQQAHICMGTTAFSVHSKHRYGGLLLNTLLGDGMSSRLFQNIREKYGLAYSVYSFLSLLNETGAFGVYIGTDKKYIDKTIDLVKVELDKMLQKRIGGPELERTKAQLKGNMLLSLESTSNRMMRLGSGELYFGKFTSLEEIVSNIDAVTANDILAVAQEVCDVEQYSTIIFTPELSNSLNP